MRVEPSDENLRETDLKNDAGRGLTSARRLRVTSTLSASWVLACASLAQAQPAEGAAVSQVVVSRSWILDAVIVAAVMLLALFAVCRSSRRN